MLITDALDGYLARKMSKETSAGKILDPMSDCVLFLTIFFSFSLPPVNFPIWIPLMMMFREIVMVYLRSFLMMKNCVVGARLSGKLKTILQSVAVILVLAFLQLSSLGFLEYERVSSFLIFFGSTTALVSITSLIEYLFFYKKDVQEILKT
jgi:CDP-diacylglycerol--glycerol-3-phosphate 3-phosphatidyltransferase